MRAKTYIKKHEIIGKRVRRVSRLEKDIVGRNSFFLFCIELESGLVFTLERDSEIIDPLTNYGLIYPYLGVPKGMFKKMGCNFIGGFELELDTSINPNLDSPIQAVFLPHGAKYFCGLLLENGFIMSSGFSEWGNVLTFHKPKVKSPNDVIFDNPFDNPYGLDPDDVIFELPED